MADEVTFGGAVAAARKTLRLSQKDLAARVLKEDGFPITPQYLNDIEHDRRSPTTDHMVSALAEALGADPEYFFILAGKVHPEDIRKAASASPERVREAVLAFRKSLSKGKRR
ncbi:helix-turn-helix domain-containing protein [Teichococcus aerofrigidensis]